MSQAKFTTKGYQGASGEISFDKQGGIERAPAFFALKGDRFERIE